MAGVIVSCPKCGWAFGGRIHGLDSGLGPTAFRCAKCGNVMDSGRDEWPRLGTGRRVRYVVVSIVYAVILGLFYSAAGGVSAYRTIVQLTTGERPAYPRTWLIIGWIAVGIAVLLVQGYGIWASIGRVEAGDEKPAKASMWSVASNGLIIALAPPLIVLVVSVFARRLL
jgi:hypothetical protein